MPLKSVTGSGFAGASYTKTDEKGNTKSYIYLDNEKNTNQKERTKSTTHENAHLILGSGSSEKGADALGSAMMRAVEQGLSSAGVSLNTATYTNKNGGSTAANLANFKADVKAGVKVDYRLLSTAETEKLLTKNNIKEYATKKGLSEERAKQELGVALRAEVDDYTATKMNDVDMALTSSGFDSFFGEETRREASVFLNEKVAQMKEQDPSSVLFYNKYTGEYMELLDKSGASQPFQDPNRQKEWMDDLKMTPEDAMFNGALMIVGGSVGMAGKIALGLKTGVAAVTEYSLLEGAKNVVFNYGFQVGKNVGTQILENGWGNADGIVDGMKNTANYFYNNGISGIDFRKALVTDIDKTNLVFAGWLGSVGATKSNIKQYTQDIQTRVANLNKEIAKFEKGLENPNRKTKLVNKISSRELEKMGLEIQKTNINNYKKGTNKINKVVPAVVNILER